jgi:hypothetical protein
MSVVSMAELRTLVDDALAGRRPLAELRDYVFLVHDGEDVEVERSLHAVLPALEPYFLHEEAYGDPKARRRLRRLAESLALENVSPEKVIFALEFEEAKDAIAKRESGLVSSATLWSLLNNLSPIDFDVRKIERWASAHRNLGELDVRLLTD